MRKLVSIMVLLGCLPGCVPANIVEADGPRVTYSWDSQKTELSKVYTLAFSYCDYWNAPPEVVADDATGDLHRTTFACVPRPSMPFGQSPAGKLINRF